MFQKEGASAGRGFAEKLMPGIKENSFKDQAAHKLGLQSKEQPFPLHLKDGGMANDHTSYEDKAGMRDVDRMPGYKEPGRSRHAAGDMVSASELDSDHPLHRGDVNKLAIGGAAKVRHGEMTMDGKVK